MKTRLFIFAASLLGWTAAFAQNPNPGIVLVTSAPSGACTVNLPDEQVITLGTLYSCQSGTWAQITGGGGGGAVSSVFGRTGAVVAVANDYNFNLLAGNLGLLQGPVSITGILCDSAGTLSQCVAGTDYQAPITLTTTGTSGAATFISNTLNIPQYAGLSNPMTTAGDMIDGGSSGVPARLAGPTSGTVPYNLVSIPSGGAATAPAWGLPGVPGRNVSGTTDTVALTDRGSTIAFTSASPVAETFTSPATLGNNISLALHNIAAGAMTATLGAGNFNSTGSSAKVLQNGEWCATSSFDNVNIDDRCSSGLTTTDATLTPTYTAAGIQLALALGHANSWSAAQTFSAAGAASTPGMSVTGAPYSAGSATTNFPQIYYNCTSSTQPTTLSTAGTIYGSNTCTGFAGNVFDMHANGGASLANISSGGFVSGTRLTIIGGTITALANVLGVGSTSGLLFGSTSSYSAPDVGLDRSASGVVEVSNGTVGNASGTLKATTLQATGFTVTTHCAAAGTAANPSVASCSAATAGFFSCATNASTGTCTVNTSAVTANSVIQIQPDASLGTALSVTCNTTADSGITAPRIASRSAATSFTMNLGTFTTNPECYSYVIIN